MKRLLFAFAICAIALTGCKKEEFGELNSFHKQIKMYQAQINDVTFDAYAFWMNINKKFVNGDCGFEDPSQRTDYFDFHFEGDIIGSKIDLANPGVQGLSISLVTKYHGLRREINATWNGKWEGTIEEVSPNGGGASHMEIEENPFQKGFLEVKHRDDNMTVSMAAILQDGTKIGIKMETSASLG